jgi:hypothetical protein
LQFVQMVVSDTREKLDEQSMERMALGQQVGA